ncbi:MAG TPA: glycosyltransferase [Actinomycetota bacterium]|jgi:trehalose synthase|nr:glycosyltransferase [Actinomycetota bacterium]
MVLHEIEVQPRKLDDYARDAGDEAVDQLRAAAEPLRGLRLLHVNSTAQGGGVAELLWTHVPLTTDLGIETVWAVIDGSEEFFAVTKAMHNGLQGMDVGWTSGMETIYWERMRANALTFPEGYDVVLIHDPQPLGILRVLEDERRREGKWMWRCHIDLSQPNDGVRAFIEPIANLYDQVVYTLEEFAQAGIIDPALAFIPPSIDPTSDKNRLLPAGVVAEVLRRYGVDPERPLVVQVSRFDPWKDPLGVIDAYRAAREHVPGLQLVMAGAMAGDDPEGQEYLHRTLNHAANDPGIKLLTDADGVGHVEVNALQTAADVVIQKSIREGFGLVVSEAMWKGAPVVGANVGGIRIQIVDGETGYLADSTADCAARLVELLHDPALRRRMGDTGREWVRRRFLCLREIEEHLRLFTLLG